MLHFDAQQNYILENDTVLLRPLVESDFELLKHFAEQEPTLWRYSLVPIDGLSGMRKYIDVAIAQRLKGVEYAFIVFDKKTQQYAGCTRFYDIQPTNCSMQLGYTWYGKAYQGTGLNKHCKLLLLQFAFESAMANRVEFRADCNNQRSIAAMKSIGCIEEGKLRQNCKKVDGTFRTSTVLSILKEEWEAGVRQNLLLRTM